MTRGLLDTSTVLLLPRLERTQATLPDEAYISTITLAEIAAGPHLASDDAVRGARLAEVQQAEADFDAIPFDAPAARAFGLVAGDIRRSGRKPRGRALDAMIAAIAIANDLPLYTCNPSDFAGIDGLEVVAVAHPGVAGR
ncbi:MAG TPA: type II toxin-antitoxin system VapC family toxin [Candidatus Limnocylindrales bacterium]